MNKMFYKFGAILDFKYIQIKITIFIYIYIPEIYIFQKY